MLPTFFLLFLGWVCLFLVADYIPSQAIAHHQIRLCVIRHVISVSNSPAGMAASRMKLTQQTLSWSAWVVRKRRHMERGEEGKHTTLQAKAQYPPQSFDLDLLV